MKGVRDIGTSLQTFFKYQGRFYSKTFPYGTAPKAILDWKEDTRVAARTGALIPTLDPREPTFADDACAYLTMKRSMPSFADRQHQITWWVGRFGRRPRSSITAPMIRTALEHLIASGLTPSTANKYRTALMDCWTVLDGKSARNPVRDVPKYPEGEGEIRALSHALIYRILAMMARHVRRHGEDKGRGKRYRSPKTLIRLRVMAWTGWPPAQIKKLKPEHLQLKKARAYVTPRRKGKGAPGRWLPLLPPAVTALEQFDREQCYGPFDSKAMSHTFDRAVAAYNAHRARFHRRPIDATAYDLRHSFGVLVAALYKDDTVVRELMCHSNAEQTQRYIRAAKAYRLDAAATSATVVGIAGVLMGLREIGETGKILRKLGRARQDSNLRPPA